jgi:hypothetical protein
MWIQESGLTHSILTTVARFESDRFIRVEFRRERVMGLGRCHRQSHQQNHS